MLELLWLVPALPLAGFLTLALFGARMPRTLSAYVGTGSVGLSALITILIAMAYIGSGTETPYIQILWFWMNVGEFFPAIAFHLDSLSLLMIFVVTFVGFIIHVYSTEYMMHDEGFARFFAYMNLFVCMMLVLVLADNLLLLYLGWEGVGMCSYLLIGFWYRDPANGRAARKAFVVTRVGDAALAIGMFLMFERLGTLHIQDAMVRAQTMLPVGSTIALAIAFLLLGGAVGKSAQLPLQTWLPDAMAGPTPVSALIHAATMVTAGIYLIARTHVIFELSPMAMTLVACVGVATLLLAGFSALAQTDIKRILAYSTISQIGYMFLGLGVGAWAAAMFHFMTHAFFKALLFLAAGYVIEAVHHEQNIFKMGGLRKYIPACFWVFLIGAASLSALPVVTAGFYSKDLILTHAWVSRDGIPWLWLGGAIGAFLTALYSFRLIFVVFFGERHVHLAHIPGWRMLVPLIVLAFFSVTAGWIETPHTLGHVTIFSHFMEPSLPEKAGFEPSLLLELFLQVASSLLAILGIVVAWALYIPSTRPAEKFASGTFAKVAELWRNGWGFDYLYDLLFVRPTLLFARVNKADFLDAPFRLIAFLTRILHRLLGMTVTGNMRFYAASITAGAVIILALLVVFR